MNKRNRTRIKDLQPTTLTELDDEQLVQAAGGATVSVGTWVSTGSWGGMTDCDSVSTDASYM